MTCDQAFFFFFFQGRDEDDEQVVRALEPACHFGGKTQLWLYHPSATGFSENVVQAEKSYKMLEFVLKKRSAGEGLTSRSNRNNFFPSEKKQNEAFWSVYFFPEYSNST